MEEAAKDKPQLFMKLKDVQIIYKSFQEYIQEKYITAEEILEVLYDVMEDSRLLANSVVCLDGFTGFTPSQYKVLEKLLKKAEDVYVTVTHPHTQPLSSRNWRQTLVSLIPEVCSSSVMSQYFRLKDI